MAGRLRLRHDRAVRRGWYRLALLLALTGCASGNECTLIGCASQLTVTLPASVTAATACVDGVCTSEVVGGALLVPLGRRGEGDEATVVVTADGTEYEGTVPLQRTFPNGRSCPPVCVNGSARLDVAGGTVVPS
jgi:hypothetical protein